MNIFQLILIYRWCIAMNIVRYAYPIPKPSYLAVHPPRIAQQGMFEVYARCAYRTCVRSITDILILLNLNSY